MLQITPCTGTHGSHSKSCCTAVCTGDMTVHKGALAGMLKRRTFALPQVYCDRDASYCKASQPCQSHLHVKQWLTSSFCRGPAAAQLPRTPCHRGLCSGCLGCRRFGWPSWPLHMESVTNSATVNSFLPYGTAKRPKSDWVTSTQETSILLLVYVTLLKPWALACLEEEKHSRQALN